MNSVHDDDVRVITIPMMTFNEMTGLSAVGKLPVGVPLYVIDKGIIMVSDGVTPLSILYTNTVNKLKETLGI